MCGDGMERAIEFVQNNAKLEERLKQTQAQIAETNRVVHLRLEDDHDSPLTVIRRIYDRH